MCVVLEVPPYTGSDPSDSKGWERILNPRPMPSPLKSGDKYLLLSNCSQPAQQVEPAERGERHELRSTRGASKEKQH